MGLTIDGLSGERRARCPRSQRGETPKHRLGAATFSGDTARHSLALQSRTVPQWLALEGEAVPSRAHEEGGGSACIPALRTRYSLPSTRFMSLILSN